MHRFTTYGFVVFGLSILSAASAAPQAQAAKALLLVAGQHQSQSLSEREFHALLTHETHVVRYGDLAQGAVQDPRVQETEWFRAQPNAEAAATQLAKKLVVRQVADTHTIELMLSLSHVDDAPVVLQAYVETYLNQRKNSDRQASSLHRLFFTESIRRAEEAQAIQEEVGRLNEELGWLSPEVHRSPLDALQHQHAATAIRLEALQDRRRRLSQDLADKGGSAAPQVLAATAKLDEQIAEHRAFMAVLENRSEELKAELRPVLEVGLRLEELHVQLDELKGRQARADGALDRLRLTSNLNLYSVIQLTRPEPVGASR